MKSILIFLIIVITFIFFLYQNKKEYFDTTTSIQAITLDSNYNTKNNIFVGYNEDDAKKLKEELKKIKDFDLNKSNLILSKFEHDFLNISMDGNPINSSEINNLIDSSNKKKIIYYNEVLPSTTQVGSTTETKQILYNHENKRNGKEPPTNLCIEGECINKKHLSMINGNNTVKLKVDNVDKHVIPIYTYSGGDGLPRTSTIIENTNVNRRPFQFTFYQLNKLEEGTIKDDDDTWRSSETFGYLPGYLNQNYDIDDIGFNYKDYKYYALYNAYSKSYLNVKNELLWRAPTITTSCIFDFNGYWNGHHSKFIYNLFINKKMNLSYSLGIRNVKYNKYLVQGKGDGWGRRKKMRCSTHASQISPKFRKRNEMTLVRVTPLTDDDSHDGGRKVHIVSQNCNNAALSAWIPHPYCHFSTTLQSDDISIYGHNIWEIIPIANTCSEPCKADYNSSLSCGPDFCRAPIEKKVPIKYQCPEDRPICRYYNGEQYGGEWLGHCSKQKYNKINSNNETDTIENKYEEIVSSFRYAKPNENAYKTNYTTTEMEPTTPTEKKNKDFYSEYTLKLAKNENGKLYEPDVYKHYHEHGIDSTTALASTIITPVGSGSGAASILSGGGGNSNPGLNKKKSPSRREQKRIRRIRSNQGL